MDERRGLFLEEFQQNYNLLNRIIQNILYLKKYQYLFTFYFTMQNM